MIAKANVSDEPDRYDRLTVTTPCQMDWSKMKGDQRVRFCDLCQRNVYNLVQLSRPEIDQIWKDEPERICARMIKDADGRLITNERQPGQKLRRYQFSIFFLLVLMTCAAPLAAISPSLYRSARGYLAGWFGNQAKAGVPAAQTLISGEMVMGGAPAPPPLNPPGQ